ncbi:MAG: glycosyl transferase group 1 [Verrucomicrobiales bacterium]|nr:glycosyl transferase group 1 [Verrucomicrobiales bacterium]
MRFTRFYYQVKPLLPRPLRLAVRGFFARRKRASHRAVWPINPGAAHAPMGWQGWPEGKEFALVLTHDVEGAEGLGKCGALADLETKLGFRSSFNFIPEGPYEVPKELRCKLKQRGFEVGVHDLHHDGKLYQSRKEFTRNSDRINGYLKEWGASGFRSGFMLNELEWLHDLNIAYDASTFDTDPFEPQPQGVRTIFPFWIPRPGAPLSSERNGYVELPYTLPQDSTMFLLLKERSPAIWKKKLDWIVESGGMALINVHPDYIAFDQKAKPTEYPVAFYSEFLQYVQEKYRGRYWNATAGQVASWFRASPQANPSGPGQEVPRRKPFQGKRAAVVLHSYFLTDPRPRREAEALAKEGFEIDVICLRDGPSEPTREIANGINIRRVPLRHHRGNKLNYFIEYGSFLFGAAALLAGRSFRKKYDLVHVHNMPDVLAFSAIVPKLLGAKVILDLHDPMPELMMSIYGLQEKSGFVRILKWLEKLSIGFADKVITPNIAFKELFVRRKCPADKIHIVMNSPKTEIFNPELYPAAKPEVAGPKKPFKLMYHGLLVDRHGLDTAIEAVDLLRSRIPTIEFHIFGRPTPYMEEMEQLIAKLGLKEIVIYHGPKTQKEIAQAIMQIDLGLIPNKRSAFTEINMPTRIFEYLAMGKPVVSPDTKGIRDYFDRKTMLFFEPGDRKDLANVILEAYSNPERLDEVLHLGMQVYEKHTWHVQNEHLLSVVQGLLTKT